MPHFKCVPCKTRLYSAESADEQVGDLCPRCGSLLEPVGELAEVVGFQTIKSRDSAHGGDGPGTHQRIADRVDDFLGRRAAILAQARLEGERWLDDGGSLSPEALAEALALPAPEEGP